jgi:hypothetical protein
MAKNLLPEIAKMLGVELGEEFKVEGDNRTYWFDLDGLHSGEYVAEDEDDAMLHDLLCGEVEIIKIPWKPKLNERYWTFMSSLEGGKLYVLNYMWDNSVIDVALHKVGWVFRTREEAQAALPSVAKELGVEYKL